ncbi:hypothetical protein GURASL_10540 [Geotalea uraniireducens]|uniref:Radical SAM protein n=1 Tax=Geotalea uraniireducens TaxID=351604 RepID=A0ABN6VTI4_9BACT|nr:hypothetical protein [Geotalea uraniireducens]BDV42131.1 hypothetical protein GURASL_10540 [Geotalea uraniireducens]
MKLHLDQHKLQRLLDRPRPETAVDRLYREGSVFFVGGALPVYQTLETMLASFCLAATGLFHVSFAGGDGFRQGEELARQLKKNFSVRLLGRLAGPLPAEAGLRAYAAGVDLLDIPSGAADTEPAVWEALLTAREVFPRWGVASTLRGGAPPATTRRAIDRLLAGGIVPLLTLDAAPPAELALLFRHLLTGWERHGVALPPYLPLLDLTTPLVAAAPAGRWRGLLERLRDRQLLAAADWRRRLRVSGGDASFDSAGL